MQPVHRCPIDGTVYDTGSVSDILHQYLGATWGDEDTILDVLSSRRDLFFEWQQSVVRELLIHFAAHVKGSPGPETYDDAAFQVWMRKWNRIGMAVGPRQPELAELLYKSLLRSLRDAQSSWGWVPKGLAYHQIGWSKILTGREDDIRAAEHYFVVAMIEDIIHDLNGMVTAHPYTQKPAYKVLVTLYQKQRTFLDDVHAFTSRTYVATNEWRRELLIRNAELIWLERFTRDRMASDGA